MTHDLHSYMRQLSTKMDSEYARVRKSARNDPGTAGDEGEENWAQLLRDWLPPGYHVVTKGQLLDERGSLSPQVDIIILRPSYPPSLHNKKKYLLSGVAAVFECKLTLRKAHIDRVLATTASIKRMARTRTGTPYRELMSSPLCGLLAHSHVFGSRGRSDAAARKVGDVLGAADARHVRHPREMIDLVCVSDLATWVATKQPLADPSDEINSEYRRRLNPEGEPTTAYFAHAGTPGVLAQRNPDFTPIGVLVTELLVKLAWEDASLRDIASYFVGVEFSTTASGESRSWPLKIYSPKLRKQLTLERLGKDLDWNEWAWSIE